MTETKAIQKTTTETLADLFRQRKDSIAQLVPKHMTSERLMRVAINCVSKTPGLQQCTPTSLFQSFLVAAELGLEPGGALGHLYLVPFKQVCTPIVGYRGLLALARRSGEIAGIHATVAYDKDKFRFTKGIEQTIDHEPFLDGDAGPLRYAYAVAKLKDGTVMIEVMSKPQIDAIRARSRSSTNGPWVTDYDEMAKKTVFRRLAKWLPLSSELFEKALEHDNSDYVDGEVVQQALNEQTESVKERIGAKVRRLPSADVKAPEEIAEEPMPEESAPQSA